MIMTGFGAASRAMSLVLLPATAMVGTGLAAFLRKPDAVVVAAMQHFAAGIVLSAVAVELVPIIQAAPSSIPNNLSIIIGFVSGVAIFVCVGHFCETDEADESEQDGDAEAADSVSTVRRSKLSMLRLYSRDEAEVAPPPKPPCEAVPLFLEARRPPDRAPSSTSTRGKTTKFPMTMLLAVSVDALCDGFLIGITAATGTNAGFVLAVALTIEMGFLSLTLAAVLRSFAAASPRGSFAAYAAIVVPPSILVAGGLAGASDLGAWQPAVQSSLTAVAVAEHVALNVALISFGIAALLYLVTEELLLEAHESQGDRAHIPWVDSCFFAGFLAPFLLDKIA